MDSAGHPRRRQIAIHALKPILRAYVLGHLSSTAPRIVSCLQRIWKNDLDHKQKFKELSSVFGSSLRLESFPTFCGLLIGGSTILPLLCFRILRRVSRSLGSRADILASAKSLRLVRFIATLVSAWFTFGLLNQKPIKLQGNLEERQNGASQRNVTGKNDGNAAALGRPQLAGRTMDLTLFSLTRAVDSMACMAWARWRLRRKSQGHRTLVEVYAPQLADAGLFAASAAIVMWAWFYMPERLPRSYGKWIGEAAKVDNRLIEALRRARRGVFVYGKDTGQAPLLESMCKDYSWPVEWGDPMKTVPIPCEMVHMGCGPSCEKHAAYRFARTFKFACATYIPLQIAFRLRNIKSRSSIYRAISDALRSSSFLASFVSIFYYSVCLARTRIGPKIFDKETVTPLMWDSGLCVGAGCLMCGWSILVENARRRQEIALFVAPRAAATVLPRYYDKKYQYRERATFAISAAILLTCLQERPSLVRGVFGKIATSVLK
ncbi:integral membrane protein [Aspergillus steynii IBT 23096]|uniref:Integral membrane protein n=1 Tax=Aspergillus steynii IBT 23096 TaxID=1392250 RepID=A0A2I2G4L8_9EURO|nr:uncharacterized protein P170DRAFT_198381 [Aspergillus steynii IBT 23096]PLB47818.1 integral membrane protein [Aspergillus steynii IBT 23096]